MANNLPLIEVDYYNSIWNKRILTPQPLEMTNAGVLPIPGGTGCAANLGTWPINNVFAPPLTVNPAYEISASGDTISSNQSVSEYNFYTEEMYIRGGFNNNSMSYGVRAYLDEEEPNQQHRFNTLIYSGIFNSRTGLNRTNEFPVGTNITRSANPQYGSIQKIYAEENNLIVLQENKCSRALIDKNAIYNAEGGRSIVSERQVLGEIIPYTGEYGISKNPESFAIQTFRKYFVDRNRNAVLRLSGDGITEISEYGMRDWFRDNLAILNDEYTNEFTYDPSVTGIQTSQNNNVSYFQFSVGTVLFECSIILGSKIFWSEDSGATYIDTGAVVIGFGGVDHVPPSNKYILTSKILDGSTFMSAGTNGRVKFVAPYRSRVYGGWDAYNKQYIVSLQYNNTKTFTPSGSDSTPQNRIPNRDTTHYTLGFDDAINGWPSFYNFMPTLIGSLKNDFLTINNQPYPFSDNNSSTATPSQPMGLYQHYAVSVARCEFYSTSNVASVSLVANANPSLQKNFLTIDYEGASGWTATVLTSDETGSNVDRSAGGAATGSFSSSQDVGSTILSYVEGTYDAAGNTGTAANPTNSPLLRAGFDRKENRYVANFINNTTQSPGEVIFGAQMSGLKGYYLDITFSTDTVTDPGAMKELYSIGLTYNVSSR